MKKRVITILSIVTIIGVVLTGCNKQLIDTTYSFDKAIIELQNGEIVEGKIQSWNDYEDGDQIQVKIDGKTYLVHSSKVTMIKE